MSKEDADYWDDIEAMELMEMEVADKDEKIRVLQQKLGRAWKGLVLGIEKREWVKKADEKQSRTWVRKR